MNITLDLPPPQVGDLELQHYELLPGGHWFPRFCTARHRVAVIVPFRDREIHLRYFLSVIHSFLQRQLLQYTIFVVEQVLCLQRDVFNKIFTGCPHGLPSWSSTRVGLASNLTGLQGASVVPRCTNLVFLIDVP